ncbi:MAG: hypothetical protein EA398_07195 [Deltaproteobacteria bacterium]|nr:MAG: hypothetical protein EA398_07195 [Deltaproteobacteria bacterium]
MFPPQHSTRTTPNPPYALLVVLCLVVTTQEARTEMLGHDAHDDALQRAIHERTQVHLQTLRDSAFPAHTFAVRELHTLPHTPVSWVSIRGIGLTTQASQLQNTLPADTFISVVQHEHGHARVIAFGFNMDSPNPRITTMFQRASSWPVIPPDLHDAEEWGALGLVDIDAVMPFLLVDWIGPGTRDSHAMTLRALATATWDTLTCEHPDTFSQPCIPDADLRARLARADQPDQHPVPARLEPLPVAPATLLAGLLMRFDPDPLHPPVLTARALTDRIHDPSLRHELLLNLARVAADEHSDGPNRLRAAHAIRLLLDHHDRNLDTEGFPRLADRLVRNGQAFEHPAQPEHEEEPEPYPRP